MASRALTLAVFATAAGLSSCGRYESRAGVAELLNLTALPASAQVSACESPPNVITDVIVKCTVVVAPDEFPLLLKGHAFQQQGNKYVAWPKTFNGGWVKVEPNATRSQAVIDVYIE